MITNPVKLFRSSNSTLPDATDVLIIGSGMGSLCAAALLVKEGLGVTILERNYLPGGCSSSYERKGFVFESGATTLVGLDKGMPLAEVMKQTGISFPVRKLDKPMKVILRSGKTLIRYENLSQWIDEAERVFGKKGQKVFWEECYSISKLVWNVSSRQLNFPPDKLTDLLAIAGNVRPADVRLLPYIFSDTLALMKKHNLETNKEFIEFIDEQLMITAQNTYENVNALFGATALCYTLFGNYYVDGGLIRMISAFTEYIESHGGKIFYRTGVKKIQRSGQGFNVETNDTSIQCQRIISGIPLNNLRQIYSFKEEKLPYKEMEPRELNSAFQVGIVFKSEKKFDCLHYQLHHQKTFSIKCSGSIFISLSHPNDKLRADQGYIVASVSTHISNPDTWKGDKSIVLKEVVSILIEHGFFQESDIVYMHSSGPKEWESWTGRFAGFVGGYPQNLQVKPWQMNSARLEKGLYACGDSVYPGQGIPGVALSGMIAAKKLISD
ncbi:MAG: NAD(P)/FAD-dependent oxidoreductase [Bacteroidia bacterium]